MPELGAGMNAALSHGCLEAASDRCFRCARSRASVACAPSIDGLSCSTSAHSWSGGIGQACTFLDHRRPPVAPSPLPSPDGPTIADYRVETDQIWIVRDGSRPPAEPADLQ
jgi:hypothetical protein